MPKLKKKKLSAAALEAVVSELPVRAGMPAKDSIIGVTIPRKR